MTDSRIMIVDDDHDQLIKPAMRQAVRDRFQAARHRTMAGDHLPSIQCPEEFTEALSRHCTDEFSAHTQTRPSFGTASALF